MHLQCSHLTGLKVDGGGQYEPKIYFIVVCVTNSRIAPIMWMKEMRDCQANIGRHQHSIADIRQATLGT
jgi:hypothetical protein